ncbi:MAG: hypothetical protein WDN27_03690 [Candidatus Saccharibacteria bacterium]
MVGLLAGIIGSYLIVVSHAAACPFGSTYADGCGGSAASGTAQYPGMLNSYTARPQWNVAGVDYKVGIPDGTTLTPWRSASVPNISINLSSGRVSCTTAGAHVTLNAIDFSTAAGVSPWIYDNSNDCTWTVANSKFTCSGNYTNIVAGNITLKNNEFDQAGCTNQPSSFATVGGSVTVQYNWFRNGWQHVIETGGPGSIDYRFNLIDDMVTHTSQLAGSHENFQQLYGTAPISADVVTFNTVYQHTAGTGNGGRLPILL